MTDPNPTLELPPDTATLGAETDETQPAAPPEPPATYPYRMRDEQYDLPAAHVDELARTLNRSPQDILRSLQIHGDSSRIYQEHRQRERELAQQDAEIRQREAQVQRLMAELQRTQGQESQVDFVDPSVRAVYDRVGRLETALERTLRQMEEREAAERETQRLEGALLESYEDLMGRVEGIGREPIDQREFFGAMFQLGLGNSDIPFDKACELTYRYLMNDPWSTPARNGNPPSQPRVTVDPNLRNPRAQLIVPGQPSGAPQPAQDDTRPVPGETLEQRRDRLERATKAALGGRKMRDVLNPQG